VYIGLPVKYPLFLSDFKETVMFSTEFQNTSNFIKVRPVDAELFHAAGRTKGQTIRLIVAFRKLANAPKTSSIILFIAVVLTN